MRPVRRSRRSMSMPWRRRPSCRAEVAPPNARRNGAPRDATRDAPRPEEEEEDEEEGIRDETLSAPADADESGVADLVRRRRDSTLLLRDATFKSCSSTLTDRPPRPLHRRGGLPRPSPMARLPLRSSLAAPGRSSLVRVGRLPSSFAAHAALRASIARLGLIAPRTSRLLAVLRATGARPVPPHRRASTRRSYPSRATPTRARTAAS